MGSDGCRKKRTLYDIGTDIHNWCSNSQWTIEEFASALNVSRSTVNRIYEGKATLDVYLIQRLSKIMGEDLSFFFPSDEEEEVTWKKEDGERLYNEMKEEALKKRKLERRLAEAVDVIGNEDEEFLKNFYITQLEVIIETAKRMK